MGLNFQELPEEWVCHRSDRASAEITRRLAPIVDAGRIPIAEGDLTCKILTRYLHFSTIVFCNYKENVFYECPQEFAFNAA